MSDQPSATPETTFLQQQTANSYPYGLREYLRRALWEWAQILLIRPSPRRAYAWRRWCLRCFGARMAVTSRTRPSTRVFHPWLLEMGDYTSLGDRVNVYNLGSIRIGAQTLISQDTTLCAGTHDYTKPDLPLQRSPIVIGAGVWICAEAFVGPGVTVGDNSVVGARAVVVSDVPAETVVVGNPARVVKPRPVNQTP